MIDEEAPGKYPKLSATSGNRSLFLHVLRKDLNIPEEWLSGL
jgi:hypothetical protein